MRFPAAEWPFVYEEQAKAAEAWLGGDTGGGHRWRLRGGPGGATGGS